MRLTRRGLLAGDAAGAAGGAGFYELVDRLTRSPRRIAPPTARPAEQHPLDLRVIERHGVELVVPPLHHAVVTGKVQATRKTGRFGHSASIRPSSRLQRDHVAEDGTFYAKGTAIPQRADFNTFDNPFAWSAAPARDRWSAQPSAGLHFIVFTPSSDDFHRNRLATDGQLPDGTRLELPPRARAQGFNSVLRTTHRQNFLVPPRAHRSFPLSEL